MERKMDNIKGVLTLSYPLLVQETDISQFLEIDF